MKVSIKEWLSIPAEKRLSILHSKMWELRRGRGK
jgi:hypothetical protein